MWCPACRADVAAELSSDNRRYCCARCQTELGSAAGAMDRPTTPIRSLDTERNARELLARWSTQNLLEPAASASPSQTSADVRSGGMGGGAMTNRPGLRFDAPHQAVPTPTASTKAAASPTTDSPEQPSERRTPRRKKLRRPRIAEAPRDDFPTTASRHDELVRTAIAQPQPQRTNWTVMAGQLCAYGGVGLLTCGTVLVLSGYFGGPANYAPTGWLVAAVGQMLLFLGVVTLVSGGMEQTVDEVAWRIDFLAERIVHLEHMVEEREAHARRIVRQHEASRPDDRADAA